MHRNKEYINHFRNELMDVLSLDEPCMDYIATQFRPLIRRLPPVCWLRIKHDLAIFLEETEADNAVTMRWCHVQYSEVSSCKVTSKFQVIALALTCWCKTSVFFTKEHKFQTLQILLALCRADFLAF